MMSSSSSPPLLEFRFEPALERRDPSSVITALALDDEGGRIYVGTSDGVLEEWNRPQEGGRAILGARRHVGASKKPIAAVSYISAARKIAALIDGNVFLLDEETLDAVPLPAGPGWRSGGGGSVVAVGSGSEPSLPLLSPSPSSSSNSGGITAIAAAPTGGDVASSSCLALAGRAKGKLLSAVAGGGGSSRAAVFFVAPSASSSEASPSPAAVCTHAVEWSEPLAVTTVAWVGACGRGGRSGGGAIVLGTALRYSLWRLQSQSQQETSTPPTTTATTVTFPSSAVCPLLELPADSPTATPVALSLPAITEAEEGDEASLVPEAALLLVERAGVAVGADGAPARGRPGAATFAEAPAALAIAAGGRAVVAACHSGVAIRDAADLASVSSPSSTTIRMLPWPEGATPARGQRLLAASIPVPMSNPSASASYSNGGFALVSGMRRAWALVPVSRSERALSALVAGRASEAAAAALSSLPDTEEEGESEGEEEGEEARERCSREWSWVEDVAAEAGLSLLSSSLSLPLGAAPAAAAAAVAAAKEASRALSSSSLHPAELFPLLAGGNEGSVSLARWAREAEEAAAAASAERRRRLSRLAAGIKGPSFRLPPSPKLPPLPTSRGESSAATTAAAVTAAVSEAMLSLRRKDRRRSCRGDENGESEEQRQRLHLDEGIDSAAVVLATRAFEISTSASVPDSAGEEGDRTETRELFLLRRLRSLLLSSRNLRADSNVVSRALEAARAHSLLAEFLASNARGDSAGALRVWREVAEGKRRERTRRKEGEEEEEGDVVEAACEAAADLLSDPRRASPVSLVAENVPWLLEFGGGGAKKEKRKKKKKQVSSSSLSLPSSSLLSSFPPSPEAVAAEWALPPAARALLSRSTVTSTAAAATETKKRTSKGEEGDEDEGDALTPERALLLLPADAAPWARASFLVHLVFGTRGGGGENRRRKKSERDNCSSSNGNETTATTTATELALLLVSIATSLVPPSLLFDSRQLPEWKRAEIVRAWIASKKQKEDEGDGGEGVVAFLSRARRALRALLLLSSSSAVVDLERLSRALETTDLLHEEAALVSLIRGDRVASSKRLLLVCRDAEAAAAVALGAGRSLPSPPPPSVSSSSSSLPSVSSSSSSPPLLTPDALLSDLLHPGEGRPPLVEDAVALFDFVTGMGVAVAVGGGGDGGKGTTTLSKSTTSTSSPNVSSAASLPLLPPLDASSILDAIGDDVPLSASLSALSPMSSSSSGGGSGETTTTATVTALLRRMLRARVRARRGAAVARGLARAEALEAAADRGALASRRAAVILGGGAGRGDDARGEGARRKKGAGSGGSNATCCRSCGARIGLKVFAVVPPTSSEGTGTGAGRGKITCMRCVRKEEA